MVENYTRGILESPGKTALKRGLAVGKPAGLPTSPRKTQHGVASDNWWGFIFLYVQHTLVCVKKKTANKRGVSRSRGLVLSNCIQNLLLFHARPAREKLIRFGSV